MSGKNSEITVSSWSAYSDIDLSRDAVYLLRKKKGFSSSSYEYFIGKYAGKLQTKWYGKKDALWVQGERHPQEPENYEFCQLIDGRQAPQTHP